LKEVGQRDVLFAHLIEILLLLGELDPAGSVALEWRRQIEAKGSDAAQILPCLLNGALALGRGGNYPLSHAWAQEARSSAPKDSIDFYESLRLSAWSRPRRDPEQQALAVEEAGTVIEALEALLKKEAGAATLSFEEHWRARKLLGMTFNVRAQCQADFDDSRADYERSIAIKEDMSDKDGLGYCYGGLANLYYYQKAPNSIEALKEARAWFEKDLAVVEDTGDLANSTKVRSSLGDILWRLGEEKRAEQYYAESLELAQRSGNHANVTFACYGWAGHLFRTGRHQEALKKLECAVGIAGFKGWNSTPERGWKHDGNGWSRTSGGDLPLYPWSLVWASLEDSWRGKNVEGATWPEQPTWPKELLDEVRNLRKQMSVGG
jgi:tetratricopeptide (TPR) repeat protein